MGRKKDILKSFDPIPTKAKLGPGPGKILGNLEDHTIRQSVKTKDGSVTRTPIEDIDIVNLGFIKAGGLGDIWVEKAGDTMTGALNMDNTTKINLFDDTGDAALNGTATGKARLIGVTEVKIASDTTAAVVGGTTSAQQNFTETLIEPATDGYTDLGSTKKRYKKLWVDDIQSTNPIPDDMLPAEVPLTDEANTFTVDQTFGDILVGNKIIHDGDIDTFWAMTPDKQSWTAGGHKFMEYQEGGIAQGVYKIFLDQVVWLTMTDAIGKNITWNDKGLDINYRWETNTDTATFFIDGGKDNLGMGTSNPAVSALLDMNSTTGTLLLPRMTTVQRDALTAVNGMIIYNSTNNVTEAYENGAWVNI